MPISTDSIIHYTDTFSKLEGILREGFSIKYCAEKLYLDVKSGSQAAHPMISFCDIPLSQSYKHFAAYGYYGIGLSKKWANQKSINPVLYMEPKSSISNALAFLLSERRVADTNLTEDQKLNILKFKCFTKNYSGHLKRREVDNKDYRFYDEREWRFVPDIGDLAGAPFSVSLSKYNSAKKKYNQRIDNLRFTFQAEDISYIIVEKTSQISKLVQFIRTEYANKCTAQQLDVLFSKITSTEQILADY